MASSDPPGGRWGGKRSGGRRGRRSGRRSGRRGAWLTVALVLAAVVAAGAAVIPATSLWARRTADADRERLTAVATEVAVLLSSLSGPDAEASLDRLTALSTGPLREEVTARRAEVLRLVDARDGDAGDGDAGDGDAGDGGDDDEVHPPASVVASGIEQEDLPRGLGRGDGPARARLLVAVRSGAGEGTGERLWRWRIEAGLHGDRALASSAEVAV